eukprot:gene17890-20710_t
MEEEILLVDDESVCKRQRREDVGFLSSCCMDVVVNYDEIIDSWLSEELSLFGSDSTLTPPEEVISHHETK